MSGFSESSTVQAWLVDRLARHGWNPVVAESLPRTDTEVLCEDWLVEALIRLNSAIAEAPERVDEVLPVLRLPEGLAATGVSVKLGKGRCMMPRIMMGNTSLATMLP